MIYIPIIGALSLAVSSLLEKIILKSREIRPQNLIVVLFAIAILFMLPFMFFFWKIDPLAWKGINLLILGGIVFFSILANFFAFYSLKREKITRLEPVRLLEPLFVVLLAFLFFSSERNPNVIIPAFIAGLALVFSHVKRHHLKINRYILAGIAGSLFYAIDLILTKIILDYYNPLTLYFIRSCLVLVFSFLIFRPNLIRGFDKKEKFFVVIIGIAWVVFRVATYYGYIYLGVVSTTLVLMLGPVFVYMLARIFLKEKLEWKNIASTIIILGCVLYAMFG